eukprot:NODE_6537_length_448_cov_112.323308_g4981_i0.p1 GENE.NODE_6537_length_448_cov_112.323308_g4981_i0~~NODE_6537_length_448_cov_112.323308_g4981_i0.p1  ORF type:complete len:138 (+),score=10.66 NODE_6537_length_448_cov_112.323308_g4981_i0:26-415(+)
MGADKGCDTDRLAPTLAAVRFGPDNRCTNVAVFFSGSTAFPFVNFMINDGIMHLHCSHWQSSKRWFYICIFRCRISPPFPCDPWSFWFLHFVNTYAWLYDTAAVAALDIHAILFFFCYSLLWQPNVFFF